MNSHNPQNPYGSYVVCASAGCGKTYQLARRFLFLVGAGASPAHILTITFTKKAAAEMRERILTMTAALLRQRTQCRVFEEELARFHAGALATPVPFGPYRFRPPRSGESTAREILAATQLLKITTIDSVFLDWYQKFPWEAGIGRDVEQKIRPQHVSILSPAEAARINRQAWELTFAELVAERSLAGVAGMAKTFGILKLAGRVLELMHYGSYLWLVRAISSDPADPAAVLRQFSSPSGALDTESVVLERLGDDLRLLASLLSPAKGDAVLSALAEGRIAVLRAAGVLNSEMMVSGAALRGKKRDANQEAIARIDRALVDFDDAIKSAALAVTGLDLVTIYARYVAHRSALKAGAGFMEFDDTAQGCFTLFTAPEAAGARFLIHKNVHHLLLDEFQDTSLMQWSLFSTLAREMLAGAGLMPPEGGPLPSFFIVGDDKQSIYGFREADPSILTNARETIEPLGALSVPLNDSYRSAGVILDFASAHFAERLDQFPPHATARVDGEPVIPDHGMVVVAQPAPWPRPEDVDQRSAREREAAHVAAMLADAIQGAGGHRVFDKKLGGYRPLRAGDCAILYRAATHALLYEKALHEVGIAARLMEGRGFFSRTEIMDLMALIRWLAYPIDMIALGALLKSPLCGLTDGELTLLLQRSLTESRDGPHRVWALLDLLAREHPDLSARLSEARRAVYHKAAGELMLEIVHAWEVPGRFVTVLPPGEHALVRANVQRFCSICLKLQGEGIRSLHALAQRLDNMREHEDLSNAPLADDAVRLMTVHKAKGLEFPLVVLVDAAQSWTKNDRYWVKAPFHDEAQGIYYIGTSQERPQHQPDFARTLALNARAVREENLRLLYVALTRAGQYLYVTGSAATAGDQEADSDGFLTGLLQSAQKLGAVATVVCGHPCLSLRRDDPRLSALSRTPPVAVAESGLPDPRSAPLVAGRAREIAVLAPHRLLQRADEEEHASGGPHARLRGTLIHLALRALVCGEPFDPIPFLKSLDHETGAHLAAEIIEESRRTALSPAFQALLAGADRIWTEQPFVHLDGGMLVRGTMDLVVRKGDDYWIVDYKTTSVAEGQTAAALYQLCVARGYGAQLGAYARAMQAMQPAARVRGAIWFTATRQLVDQNVSENPVS